MSFVDRSPLALLFASWATFKLDTQPVIIVITVCARGSGLVESSRLAVELVVPSWSIVADKGLQKISKKGKVKKVEFGNLAVLPAHCFEIHLPPHTDCGMCQSRE